ncbi:Sxm1p NDAI_0A04280 [Naumovozyma dairenensis CBS 421]|uniref:Importin N-terminal domain-containing protein n=1 Tax=Naumovozyma dairenensis (strain ATCC 10597 / BCRC 20456 / CBS 421 / NBRC 0211 / NRRL Y-12639) TaxID=1071378 RepID=G0W447_NAUDC|nr:hypothetical protein NDAI_0A04280 [Naumovozyma dairenensis CBS 421]CCD22585.1 hypothetical protein NDAI_0A04280 [Naumovozyma dairenensis CBS 421]
MSNDEAILACIGQTMVADAKVIKEAENQLYTFQQQPGFTAYLLAAINNDTIPETTRLSAVIYFKNKIQRSWGSKAADGIKEDEQQAIKDNLIQTLVKFSENNHIRPHIVEAIKGILDNNDPWDLLDTIKQMLTSGDHQYLYPSIILIHTICKVHRWDMIDKRSYIDNVVEQLFPIIEQLTSQLVNAPDYRSSELLYLILKSFKFACLNNFPSYFKDLKKLNSWIQLHLFICSKPFPKEVLDLDPSDRSLDKRVKVNKWGFGNLNRFIHKYSKSTKIITDELIQYVFTSIIPTILESYFKIIEQWGTGSIWLGEASLYYLVEFLGKCISVDELYPLLQPHIKVIFENLIFLCVCSSDTSVELFDDDPEEYTRRYYDINKESSTADVAASDFIFNLGHKHPEHLNYILSFANGILGSFSENVNDRQLAYKQEGAMKIMSVAFELLDDSSNADIEMVFGKYIYGLISQNNYPFLVPRGLETVALYANTFTDMEVLSKIFEAAYTHFLNSDSIPVQVEAADALRSLVVSNPQIHSSIASQVPGIMEKLLKFAKEFEIDIFPEVMEVFVEKFADELTPYATDLAQGLVNQFLQIDQTILENSNGSYSTGDPDLEIQASSMLQTMSTMVMSMSKVSLIDIFEPVVKFLQVNAQIAFQSELVDLMDSLALSSKLLHGQLTPPIWESFHDLLDSFQTYAMDYFEGFEIFFETIILQGFPTNQDYVQPFLEILAAKLTSGIDYDVESIFKLLTLYALSMRDTPLFEEAIRTISNDDLEIEEKLIVKLTLANIIAKPIETLQTCEKLGFTMEFMKQWFEARFFNVFSTKLQILAILTLFRMSELPSCMNAYMSSLSSKLVTLVSELPAAIRRRDIIAKGEGLGTDDTLTPEEEEEYIDEIDDDMKETVLDQMNMFNEVHSFFKQVEGENPNRYQQIIQSLNEDQKDSLSIILEYVSSTSNA